MTFLVLSNFVVFLPGVSFHHPLPWCHVMKDLLLRTHTKQPRTSSELCKKHNSTFSVSLQLKSLDKRQLHLRIMSCLKRMWLVLRWPLPKERLFLGSLAKNPKFPAPSMHCQITNSINFFSLTKRGFKNRGVGRQGRNGLLMPSSLRLSSLPSPNDQNKLTPEWLHSRVKLQVM